MRAPIDVSSFIRGAFLYLRVDAGQRAGQARRKEDDGEKHCAGWYGRTSTRCLARVMARKEGKL